MIIRKKDQPLPETEQVASGSENIKKLFSLIKLSLKFTKDGQFTYPEKEFLLTLRKK